MFSTYPPIPHAEGLLEVIDSHDRPFVLMPKADVLRQGLSHRGVVVAIRSGKDRIVVTKRPADTSTDTSIDTVWGLFAYTRVRVGESRLDAALRALKRDADMQEAQLTYAAAKAPLLPAKNTFDLQHITLFIAKPATDPRTTPPSQNPDLLFLDKDELQGMATHFPEMLSVALRWSVSTGALFPSARN